MNFTISQISSIYQVVESFGARLKKLRLKTGLSQKDVAAQAGISASTYRDWEYGKKIMGEPYVNLALALNVSITELFTDKKLVAANIHQELREVERLVESIRKTVAAL
ncbi:MAG: XRE family transcriptional regulator [Proteobacteria bacterium]|nr:MAG: XRE family transcriptional regulator [Pseudomonadota bacterium]